jgi:hypothetical protein
LICRPERERHAKIRGARRFSHRDAERALDPRRDQRALRGPDLVIGGLDLFVVHVDQVGLEMPEQELLRHPSPSLVWPGDDPQAGTLAETELVPGEFLNIRSQILRYKINKCIPVSSEECRLNIHSQMLGIE